MTELEDLRMQIDRIDDEIAMSVSKRLDLVKRVAAYKGSRGIPILDVGREESVIALFGARFADYGMKMEPGGMLARVLIDMAVEEERRLVGNDHPQVN